MAYWPSPTPSSQEVNFKWKTLSEKLASSINHKVYQIWPVIILVGLNQLVSGIHPIAFGPTSSISNLPGSKWPCQNPAPKNVCTMSFKQKQPCYLSQLDTQTMRPKILHHVHLPVPNLWNGWSLELTIIF